MLTKAKSFSLFTPIFPYFHLKPHFFPKNFFKKHLDIPGIFRIFAVAIEYEAGASDRKSYYNNFIEVLANARTVAGASPFMAGSTQTKSKKPVLH